MKLLCAHGGSVGGENLPLKIEVDGGKLSSLGFWTFSQNIVSQQRELGDMFILSRIWVSRILVATNNTFHYGSDYMNFYVDWTKGSHKSRQITVKQGKLWEFFFQLFCFLWDRVLFSPRWATACFVTWVILELMVSSWLIRTWIMHATPWPTTPFSFCVLSWVGKRTGAGGKDLVSEGLSFS